MREFDEDLAEGSMDEISENICEPIKNLTQLWKCIDKPPNWVRSIQPLTKRSNFALKNSEMKCHYDEDMFVPHPRYDSRIVPRTLVCHDMKNGYLEDRYIGSTKIGNGYTFYHWSQIDIFVYFSHHFITLPPLSWINIAHNNGVKILGTIITEWKEGSEICSTIFKDTETMRIFANALVELCLIFKLDGWLLNIENSVEEIDTLKEFVKYLTEKTHEKLPDGLIIWYDSVISDGKLAWQNELNHQNRCFFDACDGIFLNYTWKEESLKNSLHIAKHRYLDVYVGVDIFGRNTFGGGQFNTHVAAELIRKYNLSMALFAQGWTHETLSRSPEETMLERFYNRNNAFWLSIWPYLYTHPINKMFETFFYTGVDKHWYNLHNQDIQLTKIVLPKEIESEYSDIATISDTCNCIQLYCEDNNTSCLLRQKNVTYSSPSINHLFSCDIEVEGSTIIYVFMRKVPGLECGSVDLILLSQNENGRFNKHICYFDELYAHKKAICGSITVTPVYNDQNTNKIPHPFNNDDVVLRSYNIIFEKCRLLEIGTMMNDREVACLCGFGIMKPQKLEGEF